MAQVLFDDSNVATILSEFQSNVLNDFIREAGNFRNSSSFSSLEGYGHCGIAGFIEMIDESMVRIENELRAIDKYVSSSVENYRGLENRLLERGGISQIDSTALSDCLTSVVEISKLTRDYRSDDSMAYLEYKPKYTSFKSSSVTSGQSQKQTIYGNSVSKYVTSDDPTYSVSSVYNQEGRLDSEEEYTVNISDFLNNFSTTSAESVINFKASSNYAQGESTYE